MREEPIRIGLIGAGGNTRSRHIPGFQACEGVEIVCVANRSTASAREVADEFGIPRVHRRWDEVLADPEVDAVCIGTWPYMHETLTVAALDAGKHVLCEARMATDAAAAARMLAVSRRHPGLTAQIVPAPHTLPVDRTLAAQIGDGFIGDLVALEAKVANREFPDWDGPHHWRHDRTLSGNNVMNMGIWYEAMMRWVGPAISVIALGQNVVRYRNDGAARRVGMTIPDHVDIIGEMAGGGQMRFRVSSAVGFSSGTEVDVFGTEGTLALRRDDAGELVVLGARRGEARLSPIAIEAGKRGRWRGEEEFVGAIRGLEPVTHTDLATGVEYMRWTDAVAESMRTGRLVRLG